MLGTARRRAESVGGPRLGPRQSDESDSGSVRRVCKSAFTRTRGLPRSGPEPIGNKAHAITLGLFDVGPHRASHGSNSSPPSPCHARTLRCLKATRSGRPCGTRRGPGRPCPCPEHVSPVGGAIDLFAGDRHPPRLIPSRIAFEDVGAVRTVRGVQEDFDSTSEPPGFGPWRRGDSDPRPGEDPIPPVRRPHPGRQEDRKVHLLKTSMSLSPSLLPRSAGPAQALSRRRDAMAPIFPPRPAPGVSCRGGPHRRTRRDHRSRPTLRRAVT